MSVIDYQILVLQGAGCSREWLALLVFIAFVYHRSALPRYAHE